ncbi:MAG: FHA domain-containing protein [Lachnospiraceae bacterium]|jgi:hypothetical protein|nr:FHA domain-containing protein [Lachnospiraceae bacterium]
MKRKINLIITILFIAVALLFWSRLGWDEGRRWIIFSVAAGALHLMLAVAGGRSHINAFEAPAAERAPERTPTELVLLDEEGKRITSWNIYGKNGLVIGRDTGENHVNVNLDQTAYAGMIDVEHAVLNYSGNNWYIEDISSQNGVSVQKRDGKKYRIAYGKPCRMEKGDIIHIGMTRLQLI